MVATWSARPDFGCVTSPFNPSPGGPMTQKKTAHRTVKVLDLDVFYREAGPKDAPAVLLLHGFPSSSQMFRNPIPALADCYRVLAPDYPGFGHSSMPPRVRLHLRQPRLGRRGVHHDTRSVEVRPLRARLRRAGRLPPRVPVPGPHRGHRG